MPTSTSMAEMTKMTNSFSSFPRRRAEPDIVLSNLKDENQGS
jgi:hypothetical protein